MDKIIIKNARIVNEGRTFEQDVLIVGERIEKIDRDISHPSAAIIDGKDLCLIPGCIDDQVHFREPGLTHKAEITTESRAAVAGGVTSFMDMPNTIPNALTGKILEDKYDRAKACSFANYSFFMGASNDNLDQVLGLNYDNICGIKVFMGSSTGNMLVDDQNVLESLFSEAKVLIATHCEDEHTIRENLEKARLQFGNEIPVSQHPIIRSREACYLSSSRAVSLAKKHNTRLHILHISTKEELALFESNLPLNEKQITAEACVHHLFFDDSFYDTLGNKIKCNPAIKTALDSSSIAQAVLNDQIDVIATDHAPHTIEEKSQDYMHAPSGLPLIQHSLSMMITMSDKYHWDLPFIVKKMAHDPAICFKIKDRGYIREGYNADLVLLNPVKSFLVKNSDLLYKCKWSPLEAMELKGKVEATFINGRKVYDGHSVHPKHEGKRLEFLR